MPAPAFARVLDLRPGEGALLLRLGGHLFLLLLSTTAYVAVSETLFLAAHPARLLPWTYFCGAVSSLLLTLGYGRLRAALSPAALTRAVTLGVTALLAALWALASLAPVVGAFAVQVGATGVTVLAGLESGEWVARTLDTREARRLYPLIGGLGGIGATLGALSVAWLPAGVPVAHLLGLSAAATLLAARLVLPLPVRARSGPKPRPAPWSQVLGPGFPRLLLLITFLGAWIAITARQQMLAVLQVTLAPAERARFLGLLYAALNAASIGFGVLLARPLMRRLGVSTALSVYPLLILVLAGASLALPTLALAALTLCCERLFRQNLQRPLLNIAVLPLPAPLAARTTLALRGAIENPAIVLASLAMLLVPEAVRRPVLGAGLLALGAAALLLSLRVRTGYARELVGALQARRLRVDSDDAPALPLEAGARRLLVEQLSSESPDRVRRALELLEGRLDAGAVEAVVAPWTRWSAALRARAVTALARSPGGAARAALAALRDDEPAEVGAARARCPDAPVPVATLRAWAAEPAGPRAVAAWTRLWREGRRDGLDALLARWQADPAPAARAAAAEALACLGDPARARELLAVADAVPARVLEALAERPQAGLAPWIAAQLPDERHAPAARAALAALGAAAVPALEEAASRAPTAAAALALLAESAAPRAGEALIAALDAPDPEQRYRAARALERRGSPPDARLARTLRARLTAELEQGEAAAGVPASASAAERAEREAEADDALGRALALLAVLEPTRPLRRVVLALRSGLALERGFAVEALDELLAPPWRDRVVALAERSGRAPASASASPWGARLAAQARDPASDPDLTAALAWQRHEPLRRWRLADLLALRAAGAAAPGGPAFGLGPDGALGLEEALLDGARTAAGTGEPIPLAAVWATIAARPRLAGAWLAGLAARLPPAPPGTADVSQSLPSLARRVAFEPPEAQGDPDVAARAFFLGLEAPFSELPPERLALLAGIARELPVRAGEQVVSEGRRAQHAYVVVRGAVDVSSDGRPVARLSVGEAFGVLALLADEPRSATVTAAEEGELLALHRLDVRDLLETHPGLVASFSRWIATRVRGLARARGATPEGSGAAAWPEAGTGP